jgi:hypothetical protein
MKLSRRSRLVTAFVTLCCLLFTQLAVAAYACPALDAAPAAAMAAPCPNMDMQQPGLCKAHCEAGQQTVDAYSPVHATPFVAAALAVVMPQLPEAAPVVAGHDSSSLSHSTAPPLSIRNCCFRL